MNRHVYFCFLFVIVFSTSVRAGDIKRFDVIELSMQVKKLPANPFRDIEIVALMKSPDGSSIKVDGFYHKDKTWTVRYSPKIIGTWKYTLLLKENGKQKKQMGTFKCVASSLKGFMRISKSNPYRFVTEDGKPFYPIGQQLGWGVPDRIGFDGLNASESNHTDRVNFMKAFHGKTNLIRSQLSAGNKAGVALPIIKGADILNRYDLEACEKIDESCRVIKANGWAQIIIFFQDMSLWGNKSTSFGKVRDLTNYKNLKGKHLKNIEHYMRYVVARWGAYCDIWELFNEDAFSPDDFLKHLAKVVRAADPYKHLMMTSYERPEADWCEVISLHEYMALPSERVPGHLSKEIGRFKSFGKPVLYTEFGNQKPHGNVAPVKWRVSAWTAFMNESALTFWNTSGKIIPDIPSWGGNPNAYMGAKTRDYMKVLADYTAKLPINLRPTIAYTDHQEIELWALANKDLSVLYLHNPGGYEKEIKAEQFIVGSSLGSYTLTWMDPATGKTLGESETVKSRGLSMWLKPPAFKTDLVATLRKIPDVKIPVDTPKQKNKPNEK
ncbi:MAG: hypothetical protein COA79_23830 [Planctomycetota bacterium]|nr:MAG: hypothetical protein COA79_23830 [Planctomycetota bacterium]